MMTFTEAFGGPTFSSSPSVASSDEDDGLPLGEDVGEEEEKVPEAKEAKSKQGKEKNKRHRKHEMGGAEPGWLSRSEPLLKLVGDPRLRPLGVPKLLADNSRGYQFLRPSPPQWKAPGADPLPVAQAIWFSRTSSETAIPAGLLTKILKEDADVRDPDKNKVVPDHLLPHMEWKGSCIEKLRLEEKDGNTTGSRRSKEGDMYLAHVTGRLPDEIGLLHWNASLGQFRPCRTESGSLEIGPLYQLAQLCRPVHVSSSSSTGSRSRLFARGAHRVKLVAVASVEGSNEKEALSSLSQDEAAVPMLQVDTMQRLDFPCRVCHISPSPWIPDSVAFLDEFGRVYEWAGERGVACYGDDPIIELAVAEAAPSEDGEALAQQVHERRKRKTEMMCDWAHHPKTLWVLANSQVYLVDLRKKPCPAGGRKPFLTPTPYAREGRSIYETNVRGLAHSRLQTSPHSCYVSTSASMSDSSRVSVSHLQLMDVRYPRGAAVRWDQPRHCTKLSCHTAWDQSLGDEVVLAYNDNEDHCYVHSVSLKRPSWLGCQMPLLLSDMALEGGRADCRPFTFPFYLPGVEESGGIAGAVVPWECSGSDVPPSLIYSTRWGALYQQSMALGEEEASAQQATSQDVPALAALTGGGASGSVPIQSLLPCRLANTEAPRPGENGGTGAAGSSLPPGANAWEQPHSQFEACQHTKVSARAAGLLDPEPQPQEMSHIKEVMQACKPEVMKLLQQPATACEVCHLVRKLSAAKLKQQGAPATEAATTPTPTQVVAVMESWGGVTVQRWRKELTENIHGPALRKEEGYGEAQTTDPQNEAVEYVFVLSSGAGGAEGGTSLPACRVLDDKLQGEDTVEDITTADVKWLMDQWK